MRKISLWTLSMLSLAVACQAGAAQSPLTTVSVGGQEIYANLEHLTVYTYDLDSGSTSNCYEGCAQAWPPVLVAAGETLQSPLGSTQRTDGTTQVTVDGKPVYLYAGDKKEGDTLGDGLGGIWHIVPVAN